MRRAWLLVPLCILGCATGRPVGAAGRTQALRYRPATPPAPPRMVPLQAQPLPSLSGSRDEVLDRARALVGRQRLALDGREYPATCNGLVEAAYAPAGLRLGPLAQAGDNAVTALYRLALARGQVYRDRRPTPGDLAFFRDTYDQNRDGRTNDGLTHVGIVEAVEDDGTVTVIHHVRRGVVRYRMNPARPTVREDPRTGRRLNHALRAEGRGRASALAGELFVTYGALLPEGAPMARR